jgi:transcriptional regulator with XRE-family HTH domain
MIDLVERTRSKFSQRELLRRANLSTGLIGKYLREGALNPDGYVLHALFRASEVSAEDLIATWQWSMCPAVFWSIAFMDLPAPTAQEQVDRLKALLLAGKLAPIAAPSRLLRRPPPGSTREPS